MATRSRRAGLAAAMLFCTAGAMAQQAAAPAPPATPHTVTVAGQKNASQWFRAESQHFIVFSDTTNDDVYQLLNNLEKLDHLLRIYTRNYNTSRGAGQKITLYYHNRMATFNEIASGEPEEAVGLYNSCGAGVQGFGVHLQRLTALNNATLSKQPLDDSLSYLFEAYTRHFIYRYTDIRSPASYIDGFAQYFSSVRFTDNHMAIGRAPTSIARYIYFLDKGRRYNLTYQNVIEPATGYKEVGFEADTAVRMEFLAKSWLLTHFMLSTADNRARHDQYLNLVHHDRPAAAAFSEAFAVKVGDIDELIWRYRIKGVEVKQVDLPSLPTARVDFTMLPQASTEFLLAGATLRSCPDRKTGETVLRSLRAQAAAAPLNELGNLTLSRARIDWGDAQEALPYLTEATRKDPANVEAAYLLGLAHLRIAEQQTDAARVPALEAAKTHLKRARTLDPKSGEAAFAAYRAELLASAEPAPAAVEGALAAWQNAHEVNGFARSAALAYAYTGQAAQADRALTVLAHNERDAQLASWAKVWQARLSTGVARADLLAEMRRQPAASTPFREWTVSSEDLMDKVQRAAGLSDAQGYLDTMRLTDPAAAAAAGNAPVGQLR